MNTAWLSLDPESAGEADQPVIANTRILVADDDPAVLQTVAWVLKEQGYDVSAAHGGQALFERLEHDTPDLLLLDVACRAPTTIRCSSGSSRTTAGATCRC